MAAMIEGVEVREGIEEAVRGAGEEVTGREEDVLLVARLKTSSGESDSW